MTLSEYCKLDGETDFICGLSKNVENSNGQKYLIIFKKNSPQHSKI